MKTSPVAVLIVAFILLASMASSRAVDEMTEQAKRQKEFKDLPKDKIQTTKSGLQYIELKEGKGKSPGIGQRVVVHYTGWLLDGVKFDSSLDRQTPFDFALGRGEVIPGWDEGVASMKIGGKRRLIVPAKLGYGSAGAGGVIPPDATLIFDVELLEVR